MLALLKLPRISCCSNINFEKRKISHGFYTAAPMISSKLSNFLLLLMSLICKRQHLPPMFWLDWQIPWVWPGPESACSCGAKHRLSLRWTVGGRGLRWPQSCCSSFQKYWNSLRSHKYHLGLQKEYYCSHYLEQLFANVILQSQSG